MMVLLVAVIALSGCAVSAAHKVVTSHTAADRTMNCEAIETEILETQAIIDGINEDKDDVSGADVVDAVLWFPFNLVAKHYNYEAALEAADRRMARLYDLREAHECVASGSAAADVDEEKRSEPGAPAPLAPTPALGAPQAGAPVYLNQDEIDQLFAAGVKREVLARGSRQVIACARTRECVMGRMNLSLSISPLSEEGFFAITVPHRFYSDLASNRAKAQLDADGTISVVDYSYAKPATLMRFEGGGAPASQ